MFKKDINKNVVSVWSGENPFLLTCPQFLFLAYFLKIRPKTKKLRLQIN